MLVEALLGGFGALLVLAFVFGSFLAIVPIMMAIVSILTTFLVVWGLTTVTEVSPIVQFLIALIGLGVSIDYSLLVVVRWREERAHGLEGDAAVQRAMETAGRAVVFSGTTVAIGLLALVALPLPFLRSVGYGGMLIPLISVIVAMTLLPVVLSKLGPRLDWPHVRNDDKASRSWTRWARAGRAPPLAGRDRRLPACSRRSCSRPRVCSWASANANTIAKQGDAKEGLLALERSGIGSGALLPNEALVEGSTSPGAVAQRARRGARRTRRGGARLARSGARPAPRSSTPSRRPTAPRPAVAKRSIACAPPRTPPVREVRLGGSPAQNEDFIERRLRQLPADDRPDRADHLRAAGARLPLAAAAAEGGGAQRDQRRRRLGRARRSCGSTAMARTLIWGIPATGSITAWIPLMVFAFLFGLSMDYEVFILARMREEYDATGSTDTAVVRGIGRTGRLVTSAALILFLAFVSLASGPETEIKVLATGLAAGILLDATVIRALLVPAVISLFGRWNWWLPQLPARLLRVEPSLPPRALPSESAG